MNDEQKIINIANSLNHKNYFLSDKRTIAIRWLDRALKVSKVNKWTEVEKICCDVLNTLRDEERAEAKLFSWF